jgi:hypothetical protein
MKPPPASAVFYFFVACCFGYSALRLYRHGVLEAGDDVIEMKKAEQPRTFRASVAGLCLISVCMLALAIFSWTHDTR